MITKTLFLQIFVPFALIMQNIQWQINEYQVTFLAWNHIPVVQESYFFMNSW